MMTWISSICQHCDLKLSETFFLRRTEHLAQCESSRITCNVVVRPPGVTLFLETSSFTENISVSVINANLSLPPLAKQVEHEQVKRT